MYLILNQSQKYAFGSYEQVDKLTLHHQELIVDGEIKAFKCGNPRPDIPTHWLAFYEVKPVVHPEKHPKAGRPTGLISLVEVKRLEVPDGQA